MVDWLQVCTRSAESPHRYYQTDTRFRQDEFPPCILEAITKRQHVYVVLSKSQPEAAPFKRSSPYSFTPQEDRQGWSTRLLSVLRAIRLPTVVVTWDAVEQTGQGAVGREFYLPNDSTIAIILQDLKSQYAVPNASTEHIPVIFGPSLAEHLWSNRVANGLTREETQLQTFANESFALVESQEEVFDMQAALLQADLHSSVGLVVPAVDTDALQPIQARQLRLAPILFIKDIGNKRGNEAVLRALVASYGSQMNVLFENDVSHLTRDDYHAALAQAPWMVAFSPSETRGTFIAEALAFDVPVFLIVYDQLPSFMPEYIRDVGVAVRLPSNNPWDTSTVKKLNQAIAEFVHKAPTLKTRQACIKTLSLTAAAHHLACHLCSSVERP
jgi:hypothetical protein